MIDASPGEFYSPLARSSRDIRPWPPSLARLLAHCASIVVRAGRRMRRAWTEACRCDRGGHRRRSPRGYAPGVLASAATGIVGFIEEFGGDVDRIFGDARILPDMAGSPTLKLKLSAFCQLFEESARQTGHEQFRPLVRQPVQAARPRHVGLRGDLGADPRLGAGIPRRPLPLPPGKLGDAAVARPATGWSGSNTRSPRPRSSSAGRTRSCRSACS